MAFPDWYDGASWFNHNKCGMITAVTKKTVNNSNSITGYKCNKSRNRLDSWEARIS